MSEIFEVTIKSGETLKGWHWSAKDPVTNLTIITGMNEYAKRYEPFAEWMNAQHVNIWCLDAFGQGLNAPSEDMQERWPEGAFDKTVKAIMQMVKLASSNGLPTFLMGHSMGGELSLHHERDHLVRIKRRAGRADEDRIYACQEPCA